MKELRATVRADPEHAPPLFRMLAHSPHVEEARVLGQTTTTEGSETYLVAVEGDTLAFIDAARGNDVIELLDTTRSEDECVYVLLVLRSADIPTIEKECREAARDGWIVQLPIVYHDGTMRVRAICDPAQLQETIDRGPGGMTVTIEEISEFQGGLDGAWANLSSRQREALEHATRLGYYEQPRKVTHSDVAEELDCAPQTASDHLQKAESRVIEAALDEFGPLD